MRPSSLIGDGTSREPLSIGYLIGAGIMVTGGLIDVAFGIAAEGKSLEEITRPLRSAVASGVTPSVVA